MGLTADFYMRGGRVTELERIETEGEVVTPNKAPFPLGLDRERHLHARTIHRLAEGHDDRSIGGDARRLGFDRFQVGGDPGDAERSRLGGTPDGGRARHRRLAVRRNQRAGSHVRDRLLLDQRVARAAGQQGEDKDRQRNAVDLAGEAPDHGFCETEDDAEAAGWRLRTLKETITTTTTTHNRTISLYRRKNASG